MMTKKQKPTDDEEKCRVMPPRGADMRDRVGAIRSWKYGDEKSKKETMKEQQTRKEVSKPEASFTMKDL